MILFFILRVKILLMVKEQKMEQDYAEYKKPVTLLHCIQESYQQKKVVEVKW